MKLRLPQWSDIIRLSGLTIALYETFYEQLDRPWLLLLAGSMMGLTEMAEALRGAQKGIQTEREGPPK